VAGRYRNPGVRPTASGRSRENPAVPADKPRGGGLEALIGPVEQQIKYRITTDREEPTSWVSHAAWPQIKMQEHKTAKMAQAKSSNPR
jgi:hypothetical protein